ncbi:MAG TPA: energy-coupling factor transporter transmembrane component T [Limnochordia bacterium]|nr:energy-coupling factor transporter transmembrane component T [Limnochordia bacterium]
MSRSARPRSGISWVIAGMVASIIAIEGWPDVGIVGLAFVLITLWAYPVRLLALLKRMLPFAVFAMITFTFGALGGVPRGPSVALEPMSQAALSRAGLAATRLLLVGVAASWVGLYMGAGNMMAFLARLGRRIKRIGLDVTPLLLSLGIAMRFLPLMQEEARRLHLAWQARGAGLMARGIAGRVRYVAALAVPLLAAALRRAEALAEAMEVRLGPTATVDAAWAVSPAPQGSHASEQSLRVAVAIAASWLGLVVRMGRWVG